MVVANPPAPTTAACGAPAVTAVNGTATVIVPECIHRRECDMHGERHGARQCVRQPHQHRPARCDRLGRRACRTRCRARQRWPRPERSISTVTKTDGVLSVTPGTSTTYTIAVSNAGPNTVAGLGVNDTPPAGVTFTSWTCTAVGVGALCTSAGSGAIADLVTIPNAGSVTYTVIAAVSPSATGSITNTVNLAVPGSVINNGGSTTASDTDTLVAVTGLAIGKTDGSATYTPGTGATYTITVTNAGPSDATNVALADTLPAGVTQSVNASCVAGPGANCGVITNLGTGFSVAGAYVPAGASNLVYTVPVSFGAGMLAPSITNSVTVTNLASSGAGSTATATDTDTLALVSDLAITKTDGQATYTSGNPISYTIVASNAGPSPVTGATVNDVVPASIAARRGPASRRREAAARRAAAATLRRSVNLLVGGTATFTLTGTVSASAVGNLVNTATVTVPGGVTDPNPGNNSATDTDTPNPIADLAITKTDGAVSTTPGAPITYTVVATNNGPSAVTGATVADTVPATITSPAWTCVASAGSSCPASGSGNISALVNLPVGGTATFTLTGTVSASASGLLSNTATVTVPAGTTDPTPGNNTATDVDNLVPQVSLAVAKTDGSATYTPGGSATYTVTVTNGGPSEASNVTITDPLPAGVTLSANATCTTSGTAICGTVTGTTGQASFGTTGASIAAGAGNSLLFTVPVAFASGMMTDPLDNTATATDLAASGPGSTATGTDTDTRSVVVALTVLKDDGATTYTPGSTATYAITVQNTGTSDAIDVTLADALPPGVTLTANATCSANGTSSCGTVTGTTGQTIARHDRRPHCSGRRQHDRVPRPGRVRPRDVDESARQHRQRHRRADRRHRERPGQRHAVGERDARRDEGRRERDVHAGRHRDVHGHRQQYRRLGRARRDRRRPVPGGNDAFGQRDLRRQRHVELRHRDRHDRPGELRDDGGARRRGRRKFSRVHGTGRVRAGMSANPLVNTATVTDVASGNATAASDSDTLAALVTLAVTKDDGSATYTPGGAATYTVTVANTGLSDALNVTVTDPLPAGVTLSANATCVAERHVELRHGDRNVRPDELRHDGRANQRGRREFAGVHRAGRVRIVDDGEPADQHRERRRHTDRHHCERQPTATSSSPMSRSP